MPEMRRRLPGASNVIIESNSVLRFLRPDVYLTVLDTQNPDFKTSAQEFLDRASAVVMHEDGHEQFTWQKVSLRPVLGKPVFYVRPPHYCTPEIVDFVCDRLAVVRMK